MTDTSKTSGLIRMALMVTAFIGLTVVLIVFQPGSPRNATFEAMDEPEVVTRDAAPVVNAPQETETVAAPLPAPIPTPVQMVGEDPQAADQPTNMRDMTFSAISNLKSVTTGEAPAPGQPGSLLHSVVQRSIAKTATATDAVPTLTEITPVRTEPAPPADDGTYLVRDGDTLLSIAKEVFGDTGMASEIYRGNVDIMASPDSLTPGMTLKLPAR